MKEHIFLSYTSGTIPPLGICAYKFLTDVSAHTGIPIDTLYHHFSRLEKRIVYIGDWCIVKTEIIRQPKIDTSIG